MAEEGAIQATVTGQDQQVGFRALVMKQAIEYNLAGSARNEPNQIVKFTLQGHKKRMESALEIIGEGTKRSSGIEISTTPVAIDNSLRTFTIPGWTSSSRHITTPYDLVFKLRTTDEKISKDEAKVEWRRILETTLDPEDLQKLQPDD
jgi:acylphosphatase